MVSSIKLTETQPLSKTCIDKGLRDFTSVFNHVKQLPYGRTTNRSDYSLILKEHKGTCSTKHAFLKAIAIENNIKNIELYLGVFKMNGTNTPKIKSVLDLHQLDYIPEAHCFLKFNNQIIDITFNTNKTSAFVETLMYESAIEPEQIGDYKVEFHKAFLKTWIQSQHLNISFDQLWTIRENCISKISE